jgi:hypothetical protein
MPIMANKEQAMAAFLKLRLVPRIWNPLSMWKRDEDFGDSGLLYSLEPVLLYLSDVE